MPQFIEGESEAQRGSVTAPRSHTCRQRGSRAGLFTTLPGACLRKGPGGKGLSCRSLGRRCAARLSVTRSFSETRGHRLRTRAREVTRRQQEVQKKAPARLDRSPRQFSELPPLAWAPSESFPVPTLLMEKPRLGAMRGQVSFPGPCGEEWGRSAHAHAECWVGGPPPRLTERVRAHV